MKEKTNKKRSRIKDAIGAIAIILIASLFSIGTVAERLIIAILGLIFWNMKDKYK